MRDRHQVAHVFSLVVQIGQAETGKGAGQLSNELVRHQVAEEEIVYPEVNNAIFAGTAWPTPRSSRPSLPNCGPTFARSVDVGDVGRRLVTDCSARIRLPRCRGWRARSRCRLSPNLSSTGRPEAGERSAGLNALRSRPETSTTWFVGRGIRLGRNWLHPGPRSEPALTRREGRS